MSEPIRMRRPGPGRRPLPEAERKRKHTVWITPLADDTLDAIRRPNETVSQTFERLLALYAQQYDPADRP